MSNKQTSKHILGIDLGTDCELESMMEEGKVFLQEFCSNRMVVGSSHDPNLFWKVFQQLCFHICLWELLQNQTEEVAAAAAAAEGAACSPYENPFNKE